MINNILIKNIESFLLKENAWIRNKRDWLKTGVCEHCGKTYSGLQYAHRDPDHSNFAQDIFGHGRGSNKRTLHVLKYPDKYYFLCPECHKEYDTKYKNNPQEFQINLDTKKRQPIGGIK